MGADISVAAAMLLVALGAWQDLWQSMADQARALLLDQPAAASAPADGVSFSGSSLRGSATQPLLSIHDVVVRGVADGQHWQWHLGDVILTLHPNDVNRIEATLPSPQNLYADGPLGRTAITVWSRNLAATISLFDDGRLHAVNAIGDGLTLVAPGAEAEAAGLALLVDHRPDDSVGIAGSLDHILLPETYRLAPPLGGSIDVARLNAWATGLAPTAPDSAPGWRDAGGALGVSEFAIEWGPFHLAMDGRTALDGRLRPEGRFSVAAAGLADALDAAHASHMIGDKAYRGLRASLDQIGRLRGTGPADEVRLSLAMAGGTLSWSGLPLARLPSFGSHSTDACGSQQPETVAAEC